MRISNVKSLTCVFICVGLLATFNIILSFQQVEISTPSRNIDIDVEIERNHSDSALDNNAFSTVNSTIPPENDININVDGSSMITRSYSTDDDEETGEKKQQDLIVVLSMGRSGTSMMTGLFVTSDIYDGGTELKEASEFNKKGYFEDEEVVRQNIILMEDQNVDQFRPVMRKYNSSLAVERINNGELNFTEGNKFLERSYTSRKKYPAYIVKDPRLCITLPTWLHFMKQKPSVLFTYRHPVEVALSLSNRNRNFGSNTGTNAWIGYNRLAIQASADLCVVYSNYDDLLNDTVSESNRVMHEFHTKCGLPQSRANMTQAQADKFVDRSLRHHHQKNIELVGQCEMDDYGQAIYEERRMFDKYFDQWAFFIAMEMYCDMKSGVAFRRDYIWPNIPSVKKKWNLRKNSNTS